jgi:hypothetical protein
MKSILKIHFKINPKIWELIKPIQHP